MNDEQKVVEFLIKYIYKIKNEKFDIFKEYDASNLLPDDATAKLKLAIGDFIIIPNDKIEEILNKVKNA